MEAAKIILLCVGAAISYGIVHDNITVRISLEYFTVAHPPIFGGTKSPTLLALGWGVIATWWVGVILGAPAALLARVGSKPKLGWRELRLPILILMLVMAIGALLAGFAGSMIGNFNAYYFPKGGLMSNEAFMAAAGAHQASYAIGFVGGVLMWGWIWWRRWRAELLRQPNGGLRFVGWVEPS